MPTIMQHSMKFNYRRDCPVGSWVSKSCRQIGKWTAGRSGAGTVKCRSSTNSLNKCILLLTCPSSNLYWLRESRVSCTPMLASPSWRATWTGYSRFNFWTDLPKTQRSSTSFSRSPTGLSKTFSNTASVMMTRHQSWNPRRSQRAALRARRMCWTAFCASSNKFKRNRSARNK